MINVGMALSEVGTAALLLELLLGTHLLARLKRPVPLVGSADLEFRWHR